MGDIPEIAVVGAGLSFVGATVSMVSFSVSRQEYLSARTRLLSTEFRQLSYSVVDQSRETRRHNVAQQIKLFEERLRSCVSGHIYLYYALIIELVVSSLTLLYCLGLYVKLTAHHHSLVSAALALALILMAITSFCLVKALILHLREYKKSNETMCRELEDVHAYLGTGGPKPGPWNEPLLTWRKPRA